MESKHNPANATDMGPSSFADSGLLTADMTSTSSASTIDDLHNSQIKKRRNNFFQGKSTRPVLIKDLSTKEKRLRARNFDLNNDGMLDAAEVAMMNYDIDGDGHLTAAEIHAIISDLLRDRRSVSILRRMIVGLTCFVFILALSNLGTSIASAILVKETTADKTTAELRMLGTLDVMGTQASAETFEALQMDGETQRARRAMVLDSLFTEPYGEHTHRSLAKNEMKGKKCSAKNCDSEIKFDVNTMQQKDVDALKKKCEQGRVVNIKRTFPGGNKDSKNLCRSGTSITVKEKKRKGRKTSGGFVKKGKKTKGFVMIINNNGIETNFDCDGTDCALSGSNLRNEHGEPCNIDHGSDGCKNGLVCIQDQDDVTSGSCSASWNDATWFVSWQTNKCVQSCAGSEGNCGGIAAQWDQQFVSFSLCCDTYFSSIGYEECIPDLKMHLNQLGESRDCTNRPEICGGSTNCKMVSSTRYFCL